MRLLEISLPIIPIESIGMQKTQEHWNLPKGFCEEMKKRECHFERREKSHASATNVNLFFKAV